MKRLFDFLLSLFFLLTLSPIFACLSLWIVYDDRFPIFFVQKRVGLRGTEFGLIKFRSMNNLKKGEKEMLITVGNNNRITNSGKYIRKFKLDELPQLVNILMGDMSFVGPRPEVPKYVSLYSESERRVLSVRPGLTDLASIKYINESDILESSSDPENTYVTKIMPDKLAINLDYIDNNSFINDLKIVLKTIHKILSL